MPDKIKQVQDNADLMAIGGAQKSFKQTF